MFVCCCIEHGIFVDMADVVVVAAKNKDKSTVPAQTYCIQLLDRTDL